MKKILLVTIILLLLFGPAVLADGNHACNHDWDDWVYWEQNPPDEHGEFRECLTCGHTEWGEMYDCYDSWPSYTYISSEFFCRIENYDCIICGQRYDTINIYTHQWSLVGYIDFDDPDKHDKHEDCNFC